MITNLAAIQHLHLLPQLYNQVTIPEAVYRELYELAIYRAYSGTTAELL